LLFFSLKVATAQAPNFTDCDRTEKKCLKLVANHFAELYGIDKDKYFKTIQGESSWRPEVRGDKGAAYGVAQYHFETFMRHSAKCNLGYEAVDYYDPEAQLNLMACAFSKNWAMEWTVYRLLTK